MRLGALLMPSHPPERAVRDGQRWDLEEIERLDDLGFDEAWIGEHFTAAWEPCPAPDLLIAQALQRTRRICLGPLGHLLPYHHPVELALISTTWPRGATNWASGSAPCRATISSSVSPLRLA